MPPVGHGTPAESRQQVSRGERGSVMKCAHRRGMQRFESGGSALAVQDIGVGGAPAVHHYRRRRSVRRGGGVRVCADARSHAKGSAMCPILTRRIALCAAAWVLLLPARIFATDVQVVAVTPGRSADLIIDGREPITIEVGDTFQGVKVLHVDRDRAVVNVDGAAKTLPLVADPGAGHAVARSSVALTADGRGQFVARATVNGRAVTFLVDTGATLTSLSRADAARIGIDYHRGTPAFAMTANGVVRGWRLSLDSVAIGDVMVRDVDAMVVDDDAFSTALLGMSFLGRFDMQQQGATLILRRNR